jgi:hypothetical protein
LARLNPWVYKLWCDRAKESVVERKPIPENPQIREIRQEIEALTQDPRFAEMSKAFRDSVTKRLGLYEAQASSIAVEARIPVPLKYILEHIDLSTEQKKKALASLPISLDQLLEAAEITDIEQLRDMDTVQINLSRLAIKDPGGISWPEPPYDYWNVYSYSNW